MISEEQRQYANDLLKSPALQELFQSIEERYTEVWKGSSHKDSEMREDAYRMIRALSELQAEITSIAKGDKVSAYNSRLASNIKMR